MLLCSSRNANGQLDTEGLSDMLDRSGEFSKSHQGLLLNPIKCPASLKKNFRNSDLILDLYTLNILSYPRLVTRIIVFYVMLLV